MVKKIILALVLFSIISLTAVTFFNHLILMLIFQLGYSQVYYGNDETGNELMKYVISKSQNSDGQIYHAFSVQNTKNGNYDIAISALNKAYKINPKEASGYYGWVLLYYYHEYEKALEKLNEYDSYTPNFSDAPVGECIHYLKGLAYMQLGDFSSAISEFDISIENTVKTNGEDWVNYSVFLNKGRCLLKLKQQNEAIVNFEKALNNYEKCPEAFYFIGVAQLELEESEKACQNFSLALKLIEKGYKSSDLYVELFHEIYEQQVIESISNNCAN